MSRLAFAVVAVLVAAAQAKTILEIAESLPQFSTLVAVAGQAGIAPLLSAAGYKTVFAPTNEAFAAVGNNTVAWLVNPHNQQHLLSTLYYHISPFSITTAQLQDGGKVTTLDATREGAQTLAVSGSGSNIKVNNALITLANVAASNGYIQVVDHVLVPQNIDFPQNDIVKTAIATPILSTLVKAVVAAGLASALSSPNGPYVVFAPTDEAFAAVPAQVLNCLLNNVKALQDVLLFHVASGYVYSEQVGQATTVTTLAGKPITLDASGPGITINYGSGFAPAQVVLGNVDTSNGVVHVINKVLFDNSGPCKA
jgi:uncharacterized surface protein with fasciclin (FAS1) repeats